MNDNEHQGRRKVRQWKRITPAEVVQYTALENELGSGAAAVREYYPTHLKPEERAYQIRRLRDNELPMEYVDSTIQQIGIDAINRIGNMVNSVDEQVATRNAQYILDHLKGKATSKSITLTGKANVEDLLR